MPLVDLCYPHTTTDRHSQQHPHEKTVSHKKRSWKDLPRAFNPSRVARPNLYGLIVVRRCSKRQKFAIRAAVARENGQALGQLGYLLSLAPKAGECSGTHLLRRVPGCAQIPTTALHLVAAVSPDRNRTGAANARRGRRSGCNDHKTLSSSAQPHAGARYLDCRPANAVVRAAHEPCSNCANLRVVEGSAIPFCSRTNQATTKIARAFAACFDAAGT